MPPNPDPLIEQLTAKAAKQEMIHLDQLPPRTRIQLRESRDSDTVRRYADAYRAGDPMPPVIVYRDPTDDTLAVADGNHRIAAAIAADLEEINAIIKRGTRRDATLYAAGANRSHGLPLTNADKHRVVSALLADAEWSTWSDREIATRTGTSHAFVAKLRPKTGNDDQPAKRKGKDGIERRLPKKPAKPAQSQAPAPEPEEPNIADPASLADWIDDIDFHAEANAEILMDSIPGIDGLSYAILCDKDGWRYSYNRIHDEAIRRRHSPPDHVRRRQPTHRAALAAMLESLRETVWLSAAELSAVATLIIALVPDTAAKPPAGPEDINPDEDGTYPTPSPATCKQSLPVAPLPTQAIARAIAADLAARIEDKPHFHGTVAEKCSAILGVGILPNIDQQDEAFIAGAQLALDQALARQLAAALLAGRTHHLGGPARIAAWYGLDIDALRIQAERTVGA